MAAEYPEIVILWPMRSIFFFTCLFIVISSQARQQAWNPLVLSNISEQNGLSDDHVQCVIKDRQGFVWIGTSDGLNLMDGSTIRVFKHIDADTNSLLSNNILALAEDSHGNIWIGSDNGLNCFNKDKQQFISFLPPASPYGMALIIKSIAIDKKERLWCGTDGGLILFDQQQRKFTPFYIKEPDLPANLNYSNKLHH